MQESLHPAAAGVGAGTGAFAAQFHISTIGVCQVTPLLLVNPNVSFCNMFNSFDLRLTKQFKFGERSSLLLIGEVFNLFKMTNISGESNTNYSGYAKRAGAPQQHAEYSGIFAFLVLRCAGHDGRRHIRLRWAGCIPTGIAI